MSNFSWLDNNSNESEHLIYASTGLIPDNVPSSSAYIRVTGNTTTKNVVSINEGYFDAKTSASVSYNVLTGEVTIQASSGNNIEVKGHGFSVNEKIKIIATTNSGDYFVEQVTNPTTFTIKSNLTGPAVSPAFGSITSITSQAPFVNYRVAAVNPTLAESVLSNHWPLFNYDTTAAPRFTFNITITAENQVFELPLTSSSICYFAVDWGDGTRTFVPNSLDPLLFKHNYKLKGNYVVRIVGNIEGFAFNNSVSAKLLTKIDSWGNLKLNVNGSSGAGGYFYGCLNLTQIPSTSLSNLFTGTSNNLNFSYFFTNCLKLSSVPTASTSTARAINTASMFEGCSLFNENISNWDVSNVVNMGSMFKGATIFNQPLGSWNVAKVANMSAMFREASSFNQSIANWNVSNVLDMSYMFAGRFTITFSPNPVVNIPNQPLLATIQVYSTSNFNQNLDLWDVSKVENFSFMFTASNFSQSLPSWKPVNALDLSYMFAGAELFNSSMTRNTITNVWAIDKVTNLNGMFLGSKAFLGNGVHSWSLDKLLSAVQMFDGSALTQANYRSILQEWPTRLTYTSTNPKAVQFSAGIVNSNPGTGQETRTALINKGWGIRDITTVSSPNYPNGYYKFTA